MAITILQVVVLLCILIIPLRGPSKRKEPWGYRMGKTIKRSEYGVNEDGELEKVHKENEE